MIALSVVLAMGGCTSEKNPKSTTEGATQNVSQSTAENVSQSTAESVSQIPAQSTAENTIEGTATEIQAKWINDTWFPDEVFQNYIRNAFDENEDDILDKYEILEVQEIDVDYLGIKSLKGIEYLTNLTSISCSGNDLTELDVSENRELITLVCPGNALSALDLKNNTKLKELVVNDSVEVSGAGENVKVTRFSAEEAEREKDITLIREDDRIIHEINLACSAALADEKYYMDVNDTAVVTVNPQGEIEVSGFSEQGADFVKEIYLCVYGKSEPANLFRSKGYREGGSTTLDFKFNHSLYCWDFVVQNGIHDSHYYVEDYDPDKVLETKTPENPTQDETGKKTKIKVMAFVKDEQYMIKKYIQMHPEFAEKYDVHFTFVSTDNGAYQYALDSALQDEDANSPNLYMAEAAFVKKYTTGSASGYACTYEDLGIDVEQKIKDAGIAMYVADVTRRDGKVVGLSYEGTGCVFIYNRDVARDVFGDDKPETVQAAIGTDWHSFFEAAEKCKEKGYAIVSGDGDIWHAIENSADHGWVVDGKLYIDPKREAFLNYAKILKDNDYSNDTRDWTEGWFADMAEAGPKKVLGFYGPSWFINYTLTDHCKLEFDDWYSQDTFGEWGVCRPNVASFWGGTWLIANKNVLQNEELKAGVRELIEYITLDTSATGVQYERANDLFENEYVNYDDPNLVKHAATSSVVMKKSDGKMGILGGQDAFPVFIEADAAARGDNQTEYDEFIGTFWRDAVRAYTSGEYTREEAIQWFKDSLRQYEYFIVE